MEKIRPIQPTDNPYVARIIRDVMTEFGATGTGFAIHDLEVDRMYETYQGERSAFLVVESGGLPMGGAGIQQLRGGDPDTCELQKMYFRSELRGKGLGEKVLTALLSEARRMGYTRCYLETTASMAAAQKLYERLGFKRLTGPMGNTGHCACEGWFLKELS